MSRLHLSTIALSVWAFAAPACSRNFVAPDFSVLNDTGPDVPDIAATDAADANDVKNGKDALEVMGDVPDVTSIDTTGDAGADAPDLVDTALIDAQETVADAGDAPDPGDLDDDTPLPDDATAETDATEEVSIDAYEVVDAGPPVDTDGDGIFDAADNCPKIKNPKQEDFDKDGIGDVCDTDLDGDGTPNAQDCAPKNAAIGLKAKELCDGVDNNCNAIIDSDADTTTSNCLKVGACAAGALSICGKDNKGYPTWVCNYNKVKGFEVAEKSCDNVDNDCDGLTDEDMPTCGCTNGGTPLDAELCNGIDDNCNGKIDEGFTDLGKLCDGPDSDKCLHGKKICSVDGLGYTCGVETPAEITEVCGNKIDDDCDGTTDENDPGEVGCKDYFSDGDGDGYGSGEPLCLCKPFESFVTLKAGDCDDSQKAANPGGIEVCDTIDNNCDGVTDPDNVVDCKKSWPDGDADGYGAGTMSCTCNPKPEDALLDGDCNDNAKLINPGQKEACNGYDDDCDGKTDEPDTDPDADGFGSSCDTCPNVANPDQADTDGDGFGDLCDDCPNNPDPLQQDFDADGVGDGCDPCPFVAGEAGQSTPCGPGFAAPDVAGRWVGFRVNFASSTPVNYYEIKLTLDNSGVGIVTAYFGKGSTTPIDGSWGVSASGDVVIKFNFSSTPLHFFGTIDARREKIVAGQVVAASGEMSSVWLVLVRARDATLQAVTEQKGASVLGLSGTYQGAGFMDVRFPGDSGPKLTSPFFRAALAPTPGKPSGTLDSAVPGGWLLDGTSGARTATVQPGTFSIANGFVTAGLHFMPDVSPGPEVPTSMWGPVSPSGDLILLTTDPSAAVSVPRTLVMLGRIKGQNGGLDKSAPMQGYLSGPSFGWFEKTLVSDGFAALTTEYGLDSAKVPYSGICVGTSGVSGIGKLPGGIESFKRADPCAPDVGFPVHHLVFLDGWNLAPGGDFGFGWVCATGLSLFEGGSSACTAGIPFWLKVPASNPRNDVDGDGEGDDSEIKSCAFSAGTADNCPCAAGFDPGGCTTSLP